MEYRNLGRSGVRVSEISLGTWLSHGGPSDEARAVECTRRAYDLGINFFDTANEYQYGRAEEVLGRALKGIERDSYVVATKVCHPMGDGPLNYGLSRKHVTAQIDNSLRRLNLDHIDLYQCHDFDANTPLEETVQVMDDLIRLGKVLYWGVSNWSAKQVRDLVELCRIYGWRAPVSNQIQYSLLWRFAETKVIPTCEELGVGILCWSPLAMGVLTAKYEPRTRHPEGSRAVEMLKNLALLESLFESFLKPPVLNAVKEVQALAETHAVTASQLALRWCLGQQAVSSVIVGASKLSQVEENVAAGGLDTLDDGVMSRVDKILAPVKVDPPAWYPGVDA